MIRAMEVSLENLGKEAKMIRAMEVSLENLGKVDPPDYVAPGWYFDQSKGMWYYLYYDEFGQMHYRYRNPYTGLDFETLAFHTNYEYLATTIRSDAPIAVLEGDTISTSFSFQYRGSAQGLVFRFGNCRSTGAGNYNEAATNRYTKNVTASVNFTTYTCSSSFVFSWSQIEAKHLFILCENSLVAEVDTVYTNAFKTIATAEITDLKITNYARG